VSFKIETYHENSLTFIESINFDLNGINLHLGDFESTQISLDAYQSSYHFSSSQLCHLLVWINSHI